MGNDRAIVDRQPGIGDIALAQRIAHVVLGRLEPLAHDGVDIDLEQEVRAALKIETEADAIVRQPARQRR